MRWTAAIRREHRREEMRERIAAVAELVHRPGLRPRRKLRSIVAREETPLGVVETLACGHRRYEDPKHPRAELRHCTRCGGAAPGVWDLPEVGR